MTHKQKAEAGLLTAAMERCAADEGVQPEFIRSAMAAGAIVIPGNPLRRTRPVAIGDGVSIKVNANIGSSPVIPEGGFADGGDALIEAEILKLEAAVSAGADAVMDLSLGPRQAEIRKAVLARSPVIVGTVPIYQTAFELARSGRDLSSLTLDDFLSAVERQARDGVDFMTIHAGVNRTAMEAYSSQGRSLDIVSRGGSMLAAIMRATGRESPLYEGFDEILKVLARYDVTLSLGDGMRPGATADATDRAQLSELIVLGELADRARSRGVQVMIEGPGHVPLDAVTENVRIAKRLCGGAPLYVLGPLVTDIAGGHDHVAGAIGGAVAAMSGANFLCYVTPAEHLCLPDLADVREGVIASRIAAHAADLALRNPRAARLELEMARARKTLDWDAQFRLYLDSETPARRRAQSGIGGGKECTMCGEFCAIKRMNEPL